MSKIVFDLDGVLRDINTYFYEKYGIPYPQKWSWKHEGRDIFEWTKLDNYGVLENSPPYDYLAAVRKMFPLLEIWTYQRKEWRPHTFKWIGTHIGDCTIRLLGNEEKRKRLDEHPDTWLVEDNPNFGDYDRIILIKRPYNSGIKCDIKVSTPKELVDICKGGAI